MSGLLTFPSQYRLEQAYSATPEFMRPSKVPYAVMIPEALTPQECSEISENLMRTEPDPYHAANCGAETREFVSSPWLDPIERIARVVNDFYFKFDLDEGQHSWLQTYWPGGDYRRHMDGSPGQTRKLTAVAMLSEPAQYEGGRLTMYVTPRDFSVTNHQGTVVVFQSWVEHDVAPVTSGMRQTINMGFWGPPFK